MVQRLPRQPCPLQSKILRGYYNGRSVITISHYIQHVMNEKVSFNFSKLCCLLVFRKDVVKSVTKSETITEKGLAALKTKTSG